MSSSDIKLPSEKVLKHLCKLAITEDKPIMLDYWSESFGGDNRRGSHWCSRK